MIRVTVVNTTTGNSRSGTQNLERLFPISLGPFSSFHPPCVARTKRTSHHTGGNRKSKQETSTRSSQLTPSSSATRIPVARSTVPFASWAGWVPETGLECKHFLACTATQGKLRTRSRHESDRGRHDREGAEAGHSAIGGRRSASEGRSGKARSGHERDSG